VQVDALVPLGLAQAPPADPLLVRVLQPLAVDRDETAVQVAHPGVQQRVVVFVPEVGVVRLHTGVDDGPGDAVAGRVERAQRGVGLDGADGAGDPGLHREVRPQLVHGAVPELVLRRLPGAAAALGSAEGGSLRLVRGDQLLPLTQAEVAPEVGLGDLHEVPVAVRVPDRPAEQVHEGSGGSSQAVHVLDVELDHVRAAIVRRLPEPPAPPVVLVLELWRRGLAGQPAATELPARPVSGPLQDRRPRSCPGPYAGRLSPSRPRWPCGRRPVPVRTGPPCRDVGGCGGQHVRRGLGPWARC
jgi:hypothetical protein